MIGIRQRELLDVMVRHGGRWPPGWRLTYPRRQLLESLVAAGAVTRDDYPSGPVYRIRKATP